MPFSNWKGTSCLPPQDLCSSYTSRSNLWLREPGQVTGAGTDRQQTLHTSHIPCGFPFYRWSSSGDLATTAGGLLSPGAGDSLLTQHWVRWWWWRVGVGLPTLVFPGGQAGSKLSLASSSSLLSISNRCAQQQLEGFRSP